MKSTEMLAYTYEMLEAAIDMARKSGRASQLSAAKRIIKTATKEELKGAWVGEGGMQHICDEFRAVRLFEPLPLPEAEGLNMTEELYTYCPDDRSLDLPDIATLKALLAKHKAEYRSIPAKARPVCLYDFGDDKPLVNAQFLLDMLELLPEAVAVFNGCKRPIKFGSPSGEGVLLPHRRPV